jgi:hypothetical protein
MQKIKRSFALSTFILRNLVKNGNNFTKTNTPILREKLPLAAGEFLYDNIN